MQFVQLLDDRGDTVGSRIIMRRHYVRIKVTSPPPITSRTPPRTLYGERHHRAVRPGHTVQRGHRESASHPPRPGQWGRVRGWRWHQWIDQWYEGPIPPLRSSPLSPEVILLMFRASCKFKQSFSNSALTENVIRWSHKLATELWRKYQDISCCQVIFFATIFEKIFLLVFALAYTLQ